jgi:hypothetical protein
VTRGRAAGIPRGSGAPVSPRQTERQIARFQQSTVDEVFE